MIQDIAPHRMDNQYRPGAAPHKDSPILIFTGSRVENVLAHVSEGYMRFPLCGEMPEGVTYTYLFSIDETGYFMGTVSEEAANRLPGDLQEIRLRDLRPHYYLGEENRHLIFAAYTAMQLAGWYRDNRYCGTCAHMTAPSKTERALVCPGCGRTIYPRILPAVIIGVTDGDRILMTKYAGRVIPFYALVAGFNEVGETLEETVAREVMEEVGLKVKNIRYYKSQPWGIVDDLLAGFYCDVDGSTQITLDTNELKEAVWVDRKDVEGQPQDLSLTNEMMIVFRDGREPVGYLYRDDVEASRNADRNEPT